MRLSEKIVVDSDLSVEDALKQNPDMIAPIEIIKRQKVLEVFYFGFDGEKHRSQIVVDKDLAGDVLGAFELIEKEKFPIKAVIPSSDEKYEWDDDKLMKANVTSGFNYRLIARTGKISNHAFGRAIDINPFQNPFIKGDYISPFGSSYDSKAKGTIVKNSFLVRYFKSRGWDWGGDWTDRKDYMHFEKPRS